MNGYQCVYTTEVEKKEKDPGMYQYRALGELALTFGTMVKIPQNQFKLCSKYYKYPVLRQTQGLRVQI